MIVWIIDDEGTAHHCFDPFHPEFYLHLGANDEKRIPVLVQKLRLPVTIGKERKLELFSGEEWLVTKIAVQDPLQFNHCVWSLQKFFPHFVFYNSNIPVAQMYLYDRKVFPLARCTFIVSHEKILQQMVLEDSFDACTYGEVVHRDTAVMLAGRWHMDAENSFIMGESDIEGVIELARLTHLPMQKQSRAAIGTGLASMQMSYAYRNNILIPAEKKEGEDFKTAGELLLSDRGGLVFMPE